MQSLIYRPGTKEVSNTKLGAAIMTIMGIATVWGFNVDTPIVQQILQTLALLGFQVGASGHRDAVKPQ